MQLTDLAEGCRDFQKGEIILHQGEQPMYLYYVETGECYRLLTTDKGDEVIYNIKAGGQGIQSLLGALTAFSPEYRNPFSFVAKTPCHCLRIAVHRFRDWSKERPDVLLALLSMTLAQTTELRATFQSRQEGRAANRLCLLLMQNSQLIDGQLVVCKRYTYTEMAAFLGIHKVTVSRIVHSLCEEGTLAKKGAYLVITNPDRLKLYADNQEKVLYK